MANTVTLLCPAFYVFTILPQHGDSPFHLSGFTTVFILAIQKKKFYFLYGVWNFSGISWRNSLLIQYFVSLVGAKQSVCVSHFCG